MKTILKTIGFFFIALLFLSITIKEKTLFSHIYRSISPLTTSTQNLVESLFNSSLVTTKKYSKRIFENSVPKFKDTIRTKYSAPARTENQPEEVIMVKEREQLDELIKSHK